MSSVLSRLALGLVVAIIATSQAVAQGVGGGQPPIAGSERRVLVMLRMAPPHYHPGSSYAGAYGDGEGRSARWRIAAKLAHDQGLALVTEWPMPLLSVDCYVMEAPAGRSPDEVSARLSRDPNVSWSEPLHIYHGQGEPAAPNDPLYRVQPAAREWHLAALHQISTGRNVRVAVIDSMVEANHPDLVGQVEVIENFLPDHGDRPEEHGTAVAGLIAARAGNGLGIVGIAPEARLLALRACWQAPARFASGGSQTTCDSFSLARALDFAINHNAQIINMSLSGPPDLLLGKLLDVALARNLIVVAAYDPVLPSGGFPASHAGVVAVAEDATGPPIPGVVRAPGRDVPTTEPGGRWFLVDGSSFAAAQVSGLFALMRQRRPLASGAATLVVSYPGDIIDACATLLRARGPCGCPGTTTCLSVANK